MAYYTIFTPFLHQFQNRGPPKSPVNSRKSELIYYTIKSRKIRLFSQFSLQDDQISLIWRLKIPLHDLNQIHLRNLFFNPGPVCDVVINFHRDTDVRMSHHILNDLHIQICLCHSSTGCMSENVGGDVRQLFRLSPLPLCPLIFFLVISLYNIPENKVHGSGHHRTSAPAHKHEIRKPFDFHIPGNPHLKIQPSLGLKGFCHHFAHGNLPDSGFCLRHGHMKITPVSIILIDQLMVHVYSPGLQIHVLPGESYQRSTAEPGSDHHLQKRQIDMEYLAVLNIVQQIFLLIKGQGGAFLFRFSIISQRSLGRILPDDIIIYSHLKAR